MMQTLAEQCGWNFRAICAAALLLCVTGCADPVTIQNFQQIQPGMTQQDVEKVMGRPADQNYQGILTWKSGEKRTISVVLDDRQKVSEKTMEGLQ